MTERKDEPLLVELAHLIEGYLNKSMSPGGFVSRFFHIKEELDRTSTHPAIDGLILRIEEDLPNTFEPDQWREEEKLKDLRDRLVSLNNFLEFCSAGMLAEWFPKHFIEIGGQAFEYKGIEKNNENIQIRLIDESAITARAHEIQRTFSRLLEGCYKGRPVYIHARTGTQALIEIASLKRILIAPLMEIENLRENESNQWWESDGW